ncbi:pyridoxal phosphate-dependent transferase [Pelagophyceae sp. CCMP2097]|nr:pyridoxal phosphate-dependent transferase [Pelagophyceae sp. CCMP2097]
MLSSAPCGGAVKKRLYDHADDVAPPIGAAYCHVYSRASTPTSERCQDILGAQVFGGNATLFASGQASMMAAMSALLDTSTRRRRLRISGGYYGTHLVKDALRRSVDSAPLGTPLPRKVTGTVGHVVVDSTSAPPPLQTPLAFGVCMVVHSASKGLSGHSDLLAGVLLTRKEDKAMLEAVRAYRVAAGAVLGSLETWLLLRSLRTLDLRVRRQSETALSVAKFLQSHPLVARVHHAFLRQSELLARQMPLGAGGIFAIELRSGAFAKALPEALTLFQSARSVGSVESLAEWFSKHDPNISPTLVRLSVGLEDAGDLIRDLDEALRSLDEALRSLEEPRSI